MPNIVVSYRRDDSLHITGHIVDRLEQRYGKGCVFWDIDSIPYGVDFRQQRRNLLDRCDVLVAIVGSRWNAADESGAYPITDPTDWVRIEIETALSKNIPVIPVIVDRARMPKPYELPESMRDFAYRQPAEIDSRRDFDPHIERLIRAISESVEDREIEAKRHGEADGTRREEEAAELRQREDEERLRQEEGAKRRNEWEALRQQAAEAQKLRKEAERQRKETEARPRNKLEARLRQAAKARTLREDEERQRRETEARRRNKLEARLRQVAEVRTLREDEERQRKETEARRRNKLEARLQQVAEVRTLREDEERQGRESEANRRNEWEALREQAAEAQKLREDEKRQRKETEARRRNKLGARLQQVAEVRTLREDEERQRQEAEANRRNEWEALRQQAAEARIRRESEERQRQEAKAGRRNELEALRQQVAEAIEHRHAEAKRRNELEARRRQAAEEQKASQPLEHQPAEPIGPFRKRLLLRRTLLFAGALPFVILAIEAWIASTQSSPAHVGASQSQGNSAAYFTTNAPAQNRAAALIEQRSDAQPLLRSPTLPVLIADLAKCKMASGGVAIAACSRAIVSGMLTGTDLASAFDRRGILYYAQQDNDSAITDFSEAIRLDPNYASALYARGLAKNEKGDRPSGTADIAAAKAIDPNAGKQTVTSARAP